MLQRTFLQRPGLREEEKLKMEPPAQCQGAGNGFLLDNKTACRINRARGGGQLLEGAVQAKMSRMMGHDLYGVRVHTDPEADALNKQLGAKAFTTGKDIFFRKGQYTPDSSSGQKLIAHELTHVIQQSGKNDRIARWGGMPGTTSHEEVTRDAFKIANRKESYSLEAQNYIADFSESMDLRAGFLASVVPGKLKEDIKTMSKEPVAYDNLHGYWRSPQEALNHGEGGMYKNDGTLPDRAHTLWLRDYAVTCFKRGDKNQSLTQLGLAIHTAEDRGAHGDGRPGTGHDPRRMIIPPIGAKKNYYDSSWGESKWCDMKSHNEKGYEEAVHFAASLLDGFAIQVEGDEESLKTYGVPGRAKKLIRKIGIFFGRNIRTRHETR